MGWTTGPYSLLIPDLNTPIGSLHTLLGNLQQSTADNLVTLKADLTADFPQAGVVSTGSPETLPVNTNTAIKGGSNGWVTAKLNTAATAAGMSIVQGRVDNPIAVTKAGLYGMRIHVVHFPDVGQAFTQQCFTNLVLNGALNKTFRTVWSYSDTADDTHFAYIPAGSTVLGLRTYGAGSGTILSSELEVWKIR